VVGVLLVEVVVRLGAQLGGELFQDASQDCVNGVLLGRVAVPNGDQMGVEADRQSNTAELVACLLVRLG
jgi:hypothetical protein